MKHKIFSVMLAAALLTGCSVPSQPPTYTNISMAQATERLEANEEIILLDVRRPDEYATGHIPNAINIPNESIGESVTAKLPDKDALIFVYCRSGRRSVEAANKLVALGYTNIVEIGGIQSYTGELER